MNIVKAGCVNLYTAVTQIWQLRQSLFYLIGNYSYASVQISSC